MSTAAQVIVSALAELNTRFADLAAELRKDPAVLAAVGRVTPRTYNDGDRVESYVDVELVSGHAVGFWLEFRQLDGTWVVESSVRISGDKGEDELVGFRDRHAVDDESLVAELQGATSALIDAARRLDLAAL